MGTPAARTFAYVVPLLAAHAVSAEGPRPTDLDGRRPADSAMWADAVVLGRVAEVEPKAVDAPRFAGPKADTVAYRVAVIEVRETVLGPGGVTRVRVGFPDGDSGGPAAGADGVFFLRPHHTGGFHVRPGVGRLFLAKADPGYEKALAEVRQVATVYDNPVAALKARDKDARLLAAKALVYRYYEPRWDDTGKRWSREDVPAEENKLLLLALAEMSWVPADGDRSKPCLANNIYLTINPDSFGFKPPSAERVAADPRPYPRDRLLEEDWSRFLKANADTIQLKRFVRPKGH